jgi:hypothetical protein
MNANVGHIYIVSWLLATPYRPTDVLCTLVHPLAKDQQLPAANSCSVGPPVGLLLCTPLAKDYLSVATCLRPPVGLLFGTSLTKGHISVSILVVDPQ